ncbi:HDOD domain-containing protein [Thiocystis violascens]|uniref:HDOD domain-containing protein n=1 Tax=Thiocystis violascens TaxID=73141 RepID=UPI0002FCE065|nr:HDOD domain-containing protein [Thiocystis violascens]
MIALPPLPRRSHELLRLLSDPALNILRLVELIEQTPSLAARIMGAAGSPFFRSPTPPRHLSDAIIRLLGLDLVRDLSLSLILSQSFRVQHSARFDPMRYWRHAMLSATLAQILAPKIAVNEAPNPSEAYLAGLLHNLGLLALVHVAPEGMDHVFEQAEADPAQSLAGIERALLGLDHADAGGEIAVAWHLPPAIGAAMRHHRDALYRGPHWPLIILINVADGASAEQTHGEQRTDDVDSRAKLLDALGIAPMHWERAVAHWREQVDNIERLAAVLGSRLS